MTFSYTSGNPDNLLPGGTAQMADIQGPLYDIRAWLNSPPVAPAPVATTLPPSPVEGQELMYHPTVTRKDGAALFNDAYWHMRYITGKWRFLGGAPYVAAVPAQFTWSGVLGGGFVKLKTRVSIPAPGAWKVGATVRLAPSAPPPPSMAPFTLITGISDNSGTTTQWSHVGSAPAAALAGGSVSGWNYWTISSLAVPNFETWITSPQFGTITGDVVEGTISLEPVAL